MFRFTVFGLFLAIFLVSSKNAAAKFDGSVPLLCAPIHTIECDSKEECIHGGAEDVNLPQFIRINFKDKILQSVGDNNRQTEIQSMARSNGKMLMQGLQEGRGWTIVISEETGRMAATVSESEFGFIVFGACTPVK